MQQIRCEAKLAIEEYSPQLQGHHNRASVTYDFEFILTEDNDLGSSNGAVVVPISLGSITFGWTAGIEKQRQAIQKVRFADTFQGLEDLDCAADGVRKNYIYPITGSIGLGEVFRNFFALNTYRPGTKLQVFSDELRFNTTLSAAASAQLVLTPAIGRRIEANLSGFAGRIDDHRVIITIDAGKTDAQQHQADLIETEKRDNALIRIAQEKALPSLVQIVDSNEQVITPPIAIISETKSETSPVPAKKSLNQTGSRNVVPQDNQGRAQPPTQRGFRTQSREPTVLKFLNKKALDRPTSRPMTEDEILKRARKKADDERSLDRQQKLRDLADDELN